MGELFKGTDSFDPMGSCQNQGGLGSFGSIAQCDAEIYHSVWCEASRLRHEGELLKLGKKIRCPVFAIHGDWDPHPAIGVYEPLQSVLDDFHFILLKDCGHMPWIESRAKDEFYSILLESIRS
ncbi:Uncharacterised protein [uncultured archaeon]|nr:Uncharacterised protein [uncultured archaeon]